MINPELHPLPFCLKFFLVEEYWFSVLLHFGATVEECAQLEFVWSAPLPESTALPLLLVAQKQQHHHRCCSCSSLQPAVAHRVGCRKPHRLLLKQLVLVNPLGVRMPIAYQPVTGLTLCCLLAWKDLCCWCTALRQGCSQQQRVESVGSNFFGSKTRSEFPDLMSQSWQPPLWLKTQ